MHILRKNLSTLSASWFTKRQLSPLFCRPNETWNARRILQSHQNGFAIRCLTFQPRAHYSGADSGIRIQTLKLLRFLPLPIGLSPHVVINLSYFTPITRARFLERTIGIEPILPASKTGALSIGRHAHIKQDTFSFQD